MGIDFRGKNISFTLAFSGFINLREDVARITDKYYGCKGKLVNSYISYIEFDGKGDELTNFLDMYNDALNALKSQYGISRKVLEFHHESNYGAELEYSYATELLNIIGDETVAHKNYGYVMYPVYFEDFKELLRDCKENKHKLIWC